MRAGQTFTAILITPSSRFRYISYASGSIYWWTLGLYAGETKNAAVLEEAIKQAKTLLPHDKFMKRKVIEFEVTLAKLK